MPEFRAQASPPFVKVGLDFAGPLFAKDGKRISIHVNVQIPFLCED